MLWATQLFDGNTSVKLAMTGRPNTTYGVAVKCVRPLGEVTTDDDGVANVSFAFPTNLVGPVYSFELRAARRSQETSTRARKSSFSNRRVRSHAYACIHPVSPRGGASAAGLRHAHFRRG